MLLLRVCAEHGRLGVQRGGGGERERDVPDERQPAHAADDADGLFANGRADGDHGDPRFRGGRLTPDASMGETFRIGFVMARRGNYNAHLARTFTVTMGGQNLGVYSPMTTAWEQALTAAVVANAASLQLVLEAGAEPGNDSMALIDDVAVMPAHPHAARAMGNGNSFEYDANGNMTVRREKLDGISYVYTQTWTIDNRLASVTKTDLTGTVLAVTSFYYDGDGVRVRKDDPDGPRARRDAAAALPRLRADRCCCRRR